MIVGFAARELLWTIAPHADQKPDAPPAFGPNHAIVAEYPTERRWFMARTSFAGSHVVEPKGRDELSFTDNYFLGNDPSRWLTGVRNYREIVYENLYDGIDLVYGVMNGHLKYDFHISPGADPAQIEVRYDGIHRLRLDSNGDMIASTALGDVRELAPIASQGDDEIACPFVLRGLASFGFDCQRWDGSRVLIIDPLVYSTFIGGTDWDMLGDSAADPYGSVYIVGETGSLDFPTTPGAYDTSFNWGAYDGYVLKLNPDGASLAWATFFGGSDVDGATDVAVDSSGAIYVVGYTRSSDFPATLGTVDTSFNGYQDVFVARFTSDGGLAWASYLGGPGDESARAIALDSLGNVIISSDAQGPGLPVTIGAFDTTHNGGEDCHVAKLDPAGRVLLWATFLGGTGSDHVGGITLGVDDSVYVSGSTNSTDFPVTPGAFDTHLNGDVDAFIARLSPDGSELLSATYLGGLSQDNPLAPVLDGTGNIYVSGITNSTDFPVTPGAFDAALDGPSDMFVAKLSADENALLWATFLGGSGNEAGGTDTLDSAGNIWITGETHSTDFPATPDAFDMTLSGTTDGFLAKLSPDGSVLQYATFFGGSAFDILLSLAIDASGYAYLAGYTESTDFPVTGGAVDTTYNSAGDVFVSKFGPVGPPNSPPVLMWTGEANYVSDGLDPETGTTLTDFTYHVAYSDADNTPPARILLRIEEPLGTPYGTFPMSLDAWNGAQDNYSTGAIYAHKARLPAGLDFWYSFNATDGWAWASGLPTMPIDAPDVTADGPPSAVAQAFPTSAFIGDLITFDAAGSTDDFGISSYLWKFGDTATDTGAIATHAYSSRGIFSATLTVWDTANQNDTDTVPISIGNRQPIADAGADQSAGKNDVVTLNGTGSSDPDGDSLTYRWNQTGGPPVALTGAGTATPSFSSAVSGALAFLLTVEDGWRGCSNDTIIVTISNRAPAADAGLNRIVSKKTLITLDGGGSSDPDGDSLTYVWTQTGGILIGLTGAGTANPTFTPPRSGLYTFQLTVDDGDGGVSSDTVQITAMNQPPRADAGANRTARKNSPVTLDGSLSSDPDGDVLAFLWTQVSGNSVILIGFDTATPTFTPGKTGSYVFKLRVDDSDGGASDGTVTVFIWGLPPSANLVADPPVARVGETIRFNASGSIDPDGTIVNFVFSFGDDNAEGGSEAVRDHSYSVAGTYTVTLTVTDEDGNASSNEVMVEVTGKPSSVEVNFKPIVAVIFMIILTVAGVSSSRKRPWKDEKGWIGVAKAFTVTSLPFVLAEMATGLLSLQFQPLAIPPFSGWGTGIDSTILTIGIVVQVVRTVRKRGDDKAASSG